MLLSTEYLKKSIETLERALNKLNKVPKDSEDYLIYRDAAIKGFELSLETTGKFLRKVLKEFYGNPKMVDGLVYKDLFRYAAKHNLISTEEVKRWFEYRDNRNSVAHDYGEFFAEKTLKLLPSFLKDVKKIEVVIAKIK